MSTTTTTAESSPDSFDVRYQSYRLIKSHGRHFSSLSTLFLLPLFLSITLDSSLHASGRLSDASLRLADVLLSAFAFILYLSAVGTITYSAIHAHQGTPPRLSSSLKSLPNSFLRLFSTSVISLAAMAVVCLCTAMVARLILEAFEILEINHQDLVDFYVDLVSGGAAVAVVLWLQLNWGLALVVVVAEEGWGYAPLRRSTRLMEGTKRAAFSLLVLYGVVILVYVQSWSYLVGPTIAGGDLGRMDWSLVALSVFLAWLVAGLMMNFLASNVVLYMHGKGLHGEEEFGSGGGEYVRLAA